MKEYYTYEKSEIWRKSIIIIDDDKDMLDKQMKNFVHIDNYTGITDNDIENIKQILNIVQDN